jgi:transcriptional regulator with XRE-family HTH domain
MPSKYFDRVISRRKPETKIFVSKYLDIVERVHQVLKAKGMTQKELASMMDKRESEISRWLGGEHNLTLKSIAKLEAALGTDVITIPKTAFLEWKDTRVPHMSITINKEMENIGDNISFQEPVQQKDGKKTIAS